MGIYRKSRSIEASIIDFLTTHFNADWTGVSIEKSFSRVYSINLPVVCVRANNTRHDKAEIGGNSTIREVQILIDIFCTSDGQKEDFCDYIVEKIKGGCIYYDFVIKNGAVKSKTANGRIRFTSIEVTPLDFDSDNVHDRFRALITLITTLGRIEG